MTARSPYDAVVFDLDGTLWDASEASARGWNDALRSHGRSCRSISPADIRGVSGRPFADCVAKLLPSDVAVDAALLRALDHAERVQLRQGGGSLYLGVEDGIARLRTHYRLFLVSNCQQWYLESFWDHSGLKRYFVDWDCHGSSAVSKAAMLGRLARAHGWSHGIYVGDTASDEAAAYEAGLAFGHAAYGFGRSNGPTQRFASFVELVASLTG